MKLIQKKLLHVKAIDTVDGSINLLKYYLLVDLQKPTILKS